jgi:putative membrane protein insertion efficiency factor
MLKKIAIGLIDLYQAGRPALFPAACRFSPSCSQYTKQAIAKYGIFRGVSCGLKRLLRCHPFSGKFGYDPLE